MDYEEYREEQIKIWVTNGMNQIDAEQLMEDAETDPFHNDLDMDVHFDPSIDDRANKYGGFGIEKQEK